MRTIIVEITVPEHLLILYRESTMRNVIEAAPDLA